MKRAVRLVLILLILIAAGGYYRYRSSRPVPLVLTGIVTTHEIVVSPQISGRLSQLLAKEGDAVRQNQVLAVLEPGELQQEQAFYTATAEGAGSQVRESTAALRFQERQVADQIRQAEAAVAATESQRAAAEAQLENARTSFGRAEQMARQGVISDEQRDQLRTAYLVAQANIASLDKQVEAQRAALALTRTNADQIPIRQGQLQGAQRQQAAAAAQRAKAGVRLTYAELRAPVEGLIDVVAARIGEVVTPGQPVVTLINPDDLWVRGNVEETYIDRVRIGDVVTVRLPSGEERPGTVFYRGVEAGFATQRDVSRTKRDIKTFEIRLRVDNRDRRLAVGMTAYILLPPS